MLYANEVDPAVQDFYWPPILSIHCSFPENIVEYRPGTIFDIRTLWQAHKKFREPLTYSVCRKGHTAIPKRDNTVKA